MAHSSVTYIELAQGSRNQQELSQIKQGLHAANTEIISITPAISARDDQLSLASLRWRTLPPRFARQLASDVLIWFTRGHAGAETALLAISPWRISSVTYIELAQGSRNQQELSQIKQGLHAANTEIISTTPAISARAMTNYHLPVCAGAP